VHVKAWQVPLRVVTGAFILNSGLAKRRVDREKAKQLQGFASTAYPQVEDQPADEFVRDLSTAEIALGAALLIPAVPSALAGLALTGFSGSLLRLYWLTPGMHEDGDPRPSDQGIPLAKDVWMFGIGLALVLGSLPRKVR
jgi:hypothetical protein